MQKTINIWSNDTELQSMLCSLEQKLVFKVIQIDALEDLIAAPGFINIVDAMLLKENYLNSLNQFLKHWRKEDYLLLINGKRITNLPDYVKNLSKYLPKKINRQILYEIVNNRMRQPSAKRKDIFSDRVHRIIFIYDVMKDGKSITTEEICDIFDVSERTVRRDIKVLKEAIENNIVFDKYSGYSI